MLKIRIALIAATSALSLGWALPAASQAKPHKHPNRRAQVTTRSSL